MDHFCSRWRPVLAAAAEQAPMPKALEMPCSSLYCTSAARAAKTRRWHWLKCRSSSIENGRNECPPPLQRQPRAHAVKTRPGEIHPLCGVVKFVFWGPPLQRYHDAWTWCWPAASGATHFAVTTCFSSTPENSSPLHTHNTCNYIYMACQVPM